MAVDNQMSPQVRGYIGELQAQISFMSDRAAGLAGELAKAREIIELQKGRITALERKSDGKQGKSVGSDSGD